MTDLVYLVRPGDDNEELRYSLRTLANLPHDRVWFVGHLPSWVTGVGHIPGNRANAKALNVLDNVRLACEHPFVADDVIVMNDDFFVLDPCELAPWARKPLAAHIDSLSHRGDAWVTSLRNTRDWLQLHGFHDPLSFELHTPFPIHKRSMAEALQAVADFGAPFPPQWRTVYGNLHVADAEVHPDVKLKSSTYVAHALAQPLLSTDDRGWPRVAEHIRERFPDPSPYEL